MRPSSLPSPLFTSSTSTLAVRSARSALAIRRARARKRSAGAAMFIVAVTLGLLAAMGVYGLSATAYDVRAAGHVREATQAQHAAEVGIMLAAETLQPGTAGEMVRAMQADPSVGFKSSSRYCRTSKPPSTSSPDDASKFRIAEACLILSPKEMQNLSPIKSWVVPDNEISALQGQSGVFTRWSFGDVKEHAIFPFLRVELTNPINWQGARENAGNMIGGQGNPVNIKTMVRATVFIELKEGTDVKDAQANHPAQIVVAGRGHLIVGPYTP